MGENLHILAFLSFAGLTIFRQVLYFRHQHQQRQINRQAKPAILKDKLGSQLLAMMYAVIWLGTAFELYRSFSLSWYVGGIFLVIAGMIVRQRALRDLGTSYGHEIILRPNHKLVTHGVYSWIRHPLYVALAVELFGMTLISHAIWIFTSWIILVFILARRIKMEDQTLKGSFGDKGKNYQASTPAVNILANFRRR